MPWRVEAVGAQTCVGRGEVGLPEDVDGIRATAQPILVHVEHEDTVIPTVRDERAASGHVDRDPDWQHVRRDSSTDIHRKVEPIAASTRVLRLEVRLAEHDDRALIASRLQALRIDVVDENAIVPAISDVESLVPCVVCQRQRDLQAGRRARRRRAPKVLLPEHPSGAHLERAIVTVELESQHTIVVLVGDPQPMIVLVECHGSNHRAGPRIEAIVRHPVVEIVHAQVVDVANHVDGRGTVAKVLRADVERDHAVPAREAFGHVQDLGVRIDRRVLGKDKVRPRHSRIERREIRLPEDRDRFRIVLQPVRRRVEDQNSVVGKLAHEQSLILRVVVEPVGRHRPRAATLLGRRCSAHEAARRRLEIRLAQDRSRRGIVRQPIRMHVEHQDPVVSLVRHEEPHLVRVERQAVSA